jgi:hypothetical protein
VTKEEFIKKCRANRTFGAFNTIEDDGSVEFSSLLSAPFTLYAMECACGKDSCEGWSFQNPDLPENLVDYYLQREAMRWREEVATAEIVFLRYSSGKPAE